MPGQKLTTEEFAKSVAEHINSKLKLESSDSSDKLILSELRRISSLIDPESSSKSKKRKIAGDIVAPVTSNSGTTLTKEPTNLVSFFDNLAKLPAILEDKLIKKVQSAAVSILPKGLVDKVTSIAAGEIKPKKEQEENKSDPSKDNSKKDTPVAPKSLLESTKDVQKVEIKNFKELTDILPKVLKESFHDLREDLKEMTKILKTLPGLLKKIGDRGGGLLDTLLGAAGLATLGGGKKGLLKKLAQKSRIFANRTLPLALRAAKGAAIAGGTALLASKPAQFIAEKAGALKEGAVKAFESSKTKAAPIVEKIIQSKPAQFIAEKAGALKEGAVKAFESSKTKAAPIIENVAEKAGALKEGAIKYGGKALEGLKKFIPGKTGAVVAEKLAESGAGKSVATKIATSIAKRIPKSLGGALAKSIPFLGAAIGGAFAISRLIKGDYVGAALEAGSGIGSAATAIPATIALLIKDVYEDSYGVKPESDPEVGERMKGIKEKVEQAANEFLGKEKKAPEKTAEKKSEEAPAITPEPVKEAVSAAKTETSKAETSSVESKAPAITPEPVKEAINEQAEVSEVGTPEQEESKAPAITPEPVKEAVQIEPKKLSSFQKRGKELKDKHLFRAEVAKIAGMRNIQYTGGIPVDDKGSPLLDTATLNEVQKKYNQPVTENPEQQIEAAKQMSAAMKGIDSSQEKTDSSEIPETKAESKAPEITPEPVKEAVSAATETPKIETPSAESKAPEITPEPVKEAVVAKTEPSKPKNAAQEVTEKYNKRKEKVNEWIENGYRSTNDIPKEFATKSLPPAYAKQALMKSLALSLTAKGAKADTGSNENIISNNIETGEATVTPIGVPSSESKAPAITPEPVKEAVSAATETPKAEAPAITPEPVKEAVSMTEKKREPVKANDSNPHLEQLIKTNPQFKEVYEDVKFDKNAVAYLNGLSPKQLDKIVTGKSPLAVDIAIEKVKTSAKLQQTDSVFKSSVESKTEAPSVTAEPKAPEILYTTGGTVRAKSSGTLSPSQDAMPSITPVTEKSSPQNDKNLEAIASNTGDTNKTLSSLVAGFNNLARALEKFGVSVANQPPTIVNAGSQQAPLPKASSSQFANMGNSDITNFRRNTVEGSRFQPA